MRLIQVTFDDVSTLTIFPSAHRMHRNPMSTSDAVHHGAFEDEQGELIGPHAIDIGECLFFAHAQDRMLMMQA
jgi:hypothetical protein